MNIGFFYYNSWEQKCDIYNNSFAAQIYLTYNIVHTLGPDTVVHLLVSVQLVSNGTEQARTVLPHALDVVPTKLDSEQTAGHNGSHLTLSCP